jgi:hypothetical protein
MDPTGIFFLYVIASPQAECQARVNVNATHGTKTRVAYVSLHLMGSSRSIYPAGITIGIFIFPARRVRALKIRQINSAILKVPDAALIR